MIIETVNIFLLKGGCHMRFILKVVFDLAVIAIGIMVLKVQLKQTSIENDRRRIIAGVLLAGLFALVVGHLLINKIPAIILLILLAVIVYKVRKSK